MQRKISEDNPVGFNVILLGLISRFFLEINNPEKAESFWKQYDKIENDENILMSEHSEVIFCRAYCLFVCYEFFPYVIKEFKPLTKVIDMYKSALRLRSNSRWLYELCLVMEQNVHQPENDTNEKLKDELEATLRKVLEMDPENFRAKIKLARLLVNKEAVEEAKFYIDSVSEEAKSENILKKKLLRLELLGFLYMIPPMSKLNSDHLSIATDYFQRIISLDQKAEAAFYGLGKQVSNFRNKPSSSCTLPFMFQLNVC